MRRTFTILAFSAAAAVALAGCGSSDDTSTSSASSTTATTAKGNTSTTAAAAKTNGPKCRALSTYQYSELIALRATDKTQPEKDRTIAGLDKAAANLKKAEKNLSDEVDTRVTYIKNTLAGTPVPEADKQAAEKAKNQMNLYRNQNCPKGTGGSGSTTTTKPGAAAPTTTAKK